jgi:hypothetical protein
MFSPTQETEPRSDREWLARRVIGGGLLFATGAIHLGSAVSAI